MLLGVSLLLLGTLRLVVCFLPLGLGDRSLLIGDIPLLDRDPTLLIGLALLLQDQHQRDRQDGKGNRGQHGGKAFEFLETPGARVAFVLGSGQLGMQRRVFRLAGVQQRQAEIVIPFGQRAGRVGGLGFHNAGHSPPVAVP